MKRVIYIIEDDTDILTILHMFFKRNGFEVIADPNGDQLSLQSQPLPNIYLIDYNLGARSGAALCTLLRKDNRDIPVLMMSANPAARSIAKDCGADGFIEKPFQMHRMLEMIDELIDARHVLNF